MVPWAWLSYSVRLCVRCFCSSIEKHHRCVHLDSLAQFISIVNVLYVLYVCMGNMADVWAPWIINLLSIHLNITIRLENGQKWKGKKIIHEPYPYIINIVTNNGTCFVSPPKACFRFLLCLFDVHNSLCLDRGKKLYILILCIFHTLSFSHNCGLLLLLLLLPTLKHITNKHTNKQTLTYVMQMSLAIQL